MATEVNKTIIELIYKGDQADRGSKKTSMSFTELNQALELAKKGFEVFSQVAAATGQTLERGFKVDNLNRGFQNLAKSAGVDATEALQNLRGATQGLVGDTDILQSATRALNLGLSPEQFEQVTAAATKLSISMGQDVAQGVDDAATALARQSQQMLDNLGVTLRVSEAQELYAEKLGKPVKELTELERRQAFVVIGAEKLAEAAAKVGDVSNNAGVEFQKLGVATTNLQDRFATALTKNEDLAAALATLRDIINEVDVEPLVEGLRLVINFTGEAIKALDNFASGLSVVFAGEQQALAQKFRQSFKDIGKETLKTATSLGDVKFAIEDYTLKLVDNQKEIVKLQKSKQRLQAVIDKFGDSSGEATKRVELLGGQIIATQEKSTAYRETIDKLKSRLELLKRPVRETATGIKKIGEESEETKKKVKELGDKAGGIGQEIADSVADNKIAISDEVSGAIEDGNRQGQESFRETANFFSDLIFDGMNNSFRDFEDIGKRILADVGGSFLAGLTGDIGGSGGLEGIIGKLGNKLGSGLADSLMGDGGGGGLLSKIPGLGSLFGSGSGETFLLPGGAPEAAGAGLAKSIGPIAAAAAAAALTLDSGRLVGDAVGDGANSNRAQVSLATAAALTGPLAPLTAPLFNFAFDSLGLFGPGKGKREQIARENSIDALLDRLEENIGTREFTGFGGGAINFDPSNFNIDFGDGGSLAEQLIPSTSTLATLLSGGSDKLKDDLTGIFSNALAEAGSMDEALLNLGMLFDDLGISAEQAKDQFKESFLDGEISISEFGGAIQNLNLIAQENLAGEGSISTALQILTKNFDNPRAQLKSLELLFNEAQEVGVASIGQLGASLTDKLGPEAQEVFAAIEAAGITSFEDLESRSADEIFLILSQLSRLEDELQGSFASGFGASADAANQSAEQIDAANRKIEEGLERIVNKQRDVARGFERINNLSVTTPEDVNKNLGA